MKPGTALVTGASTGIGAVYADRLARRGHDLIVTARDLVRLNDLADRLRRAYGVTVEIVRADLGRADELLGLEERLRADPAIELLVNNAGMSGGGPLQGADPDKLQAVIDLNVVAMTRLAAAAAAGFSARRSGTIVNIASVTALFAERLDPVYPATKAFCIALSQAMTTQLDPSGVRVQCVLPGATRTEIWERGGGSIDALPPEIVMEADDLVDAALAGLDMGEPITIPSLPDLGQWQAFERARTDLYPNLSLRTPAGRYLPGAGRAAGA